MVKGITSVGNSHGIIFDAALLDLARLRAGDAVNVAVHEGGTITLTPVRPVLEPARAAVTSRRIIRENLGLFRRLP